MVVWPADKKEVGKAVVGVVKSGVWYSKEKEGGREVGSGEFSVVGFNLAKSVVSIDTAVGSLLVATGRERSGVGTTDAMDRAGEVVACGTLL